MVKALNGILKHFMINLYAGTALPKNEQMNLKLHFLLTLYTRQYANYAVLVRKTEN